jgi:SAM-dependent methyltransferase
MTAPLLFDHALMQARAKRRMQLQDGADFLFRRTAEDLAERLQPVLRPFPAIADIGTPHDAFARALKIIRPDSAITQIAVGPRERETLDLPAEAFDLATSGLALQHANDLPGALIQIRRALRPDGLFIGCLAGGATLTELRQSLAEAESEITGGVSPRVFPFADVRDMGGLLQRAGFALPVADSETITVRYTNIFSLMADLRSMGATNVLDDRSRRFTSRNLFLRAADVYQRRFSDPDGKIRATFEIIWLTGWAPHESQQKPLKPGSAKQRLADALGVAERKTGDKAGG